MAFKDAILQGVNIPVLAKIVDILANAVVEQRNIAHPGEFLPYEDQLDVGTGMFDRRLTPEDGGNLEAG